MITYDPNADEPYISAFLDRLVAGDGASDLPQVVASLERGVETVIRKVIDFAKAQHAAHLVNLTALEARLADPKAERGPDIVEELWRIYAGYRYRLDPDLAQEVEEVAVLIAVPAVNEVPA
jgi:hypothetical protein